MSGADEFASTRVKHFDGWGRLPPGEYKVADDGEIVPVDVKTDPVADALRKFAASLE